MKTLITGGTTWFGQSIVQRLKMRGHEVISFDEFPAPWRLAYEREFMTQGCSQD